MIAEAVLALAGEPGAFLDALPAPAVVRPELDELLGELDAVLDAWFMGEVAPALDRAQRARAAQASPPPRA